MRILKKEKQYLIIRLVTLQQSYNRWIDTQKIEGKMRDEIMMVDGQKEKGMWIDSCFARKMVERQIDK